MAVYSLFAFGGLAAAASRSVSADVREMGLGLGHQLAKLEDLTGSATLVRLNGVEMHRASAHSQQSVHEVLDRYETYCRVHPGALARAMPDIPSAMADRVNVSSEDPLRAAVVRDEADGRGMVVCFVEDPAVPYRELFEKLHVLSDTGDLAQLGRFRYVFAEPSTSTKGGTHVVTFWSDGELNLMKMFPASGDAPGTDSAYAPRPAGSRRTLSAAVDGFPAAVRIYESRASRAELEKHYDETLRGAGFTKIETPRGERGAAYLHGNDAEVILAFAQSSGGGAPRTTVTIVEASASPSQGVRVEVGR